MFNLCQQLKTATRVTLPKDLEFYHGTDSPPFDTFDPSKAKKTNGPFYNPLGNGLYATDNEMFAYQFGSHVHKVTLPKGSLVQRYTEQQAQSAMWDIVRRSLRRIGVDYWDTTLEIKMEFGRAIRNNTPYVGLFECAHIPLLYGDFFKRKQAEAFPDIVTKIATEKFGKYDAVIWPSTNDPINASKEVVVFKPEYQKAQPHQPASYLMQDRYASTTLPTAI